MICYRPLDFAPAQAGAIFAVCNTVANLSGFLAPQTTGYLLNVEESLSQWQVWTISHKVTFIKTYMSGM